MACEHMARADRADVWEGRVRQGRHGATEAERRARISQLRAFVDEGLCLSDAAKRLDISGAGLHRWLTKNDDGLRVRLAHNARYGNALTPQEQHERLRVIKSQKTQAAAAKELGITGAALSYWISRNAPFGIEDALEDFSDEVAS